MKLEKRMETQQLRSIMHAFFILLISILFLLLTGCIGEKTSASPSKSSSPELSLTLRVEEPSSTNGNTSQQAQGAAITTQSAKTNQQQAQVSPDQEIPLSEEKGATNPSLQISREAFDGVYLDKIKAAEFLQAGVEVTISNATPSNFDIQTESGEKYRIESLVKPKVIERYVNEYGLSDIRRYDGFKINLKGKLKSATVPANIMGVGPNVIGVTPEASDGVPAYDVNPLFTLTTAVVKGPNDYVITEEMDYDQKDTSKSTNEKWFEIFKSLTNGVVWTIFEQSNRYFTMVDKREWDRYTPGYIFFLMQKFEYLAPIPDRIRSIRNPRIRTEAEMLKDRFVLHDYSVKDTSIRIVIPTYLENRTAKTLIRVNNGIPSIGYKEINTVLSDVEMGDGEKFTWSNPIKVILSIEGKDLTIYVPSQAAIEINGEIFKLPRSLQ